MVTWGKKSDERDVGPWGCSALALRGVATGQSANAPERRARNSSGLGIWELRTGVGASAGVDR